jgi:hypothetical protein
VDQALVEALLRKLQEDILRLQAEVDLLRRELSFLRPIQPVRPPLFDE